MAIVVARAVRGGSRRNEEEDENLHSVLVFEADAEHLVLPPPEYTDEKVALAAAPAENKA